MAKQGRTVQAGRSSLLLRCVGCQQLAAVVAGNANCEADHRCLYPCQPHPVQWYQRQKLLNQQGIPLGLPPYDLWARLDQAAADAAAAAGKDEGPAAPAAPAAPPAAAPPAAPVAAPAAVHPESAQCVRARLQQLQQRHGSAGWAGGERQDGCQGRDPLDAWLEELDAWVATRQERSGTAGRKRKADGEEVQPGEGLHPAVLELLGPAFLLDGAAEAAASVPPLSLGGAAGGAPSAGQPAAVAAPCLGMSPAAPVHAHMPAAYPAAIFPGVGPVYMQPGAGIIPGAAAGMLPWQVLPAVPSGTSGRSSAAAAGLPAALFASPSRAHHLRAPQHSPAAGHAGSLAASVPSSPSMGGAAQARNSTVSAALPGMRGREHSCFASVHEEHEHCPPSPIPA